jgi:uncharacterized protein YcbX
MRVARIGFTPVKGGRHRTHRSVWLTPTGPRGDRAFCLVDPEAGRCIRTAAHPALLRADAAWNGRVLSVELPSGTVADEPVPTGRVRTVDYWGRSTTVEEVAGPWSAAYSAHLGRDVVLAAAGPGEVVYGGAVTLVTSASLARVSEAVGVAVDGARFRATFQLDGDLPPDAEEGWVGRRLQIGGAEVRVLGVVPRCGVIDLHPASGVRDLGLLKALAGDRPGRAEVTFGVDAEVTVPGRVATGDRAVVRAD